MLAGNLGIKREQQQPVGMNGDALWMPYVPPDTIY